MKSTTSAQPFEAITMRHTPTPSGERGRVYRRCGCRDDHRRQLGTACPLLATDPKHGTWAFAVDARSTDGHRHTIRRASFPDEIEARTALRHFNQGLATGVITDPRQTLAGYLTTWLAEKELHLKPTTITRYRAYIEQDLIPALGGIPLDDLTRQHLAAFVTNQLRHHHRGKVTVHRIMSTLSSALSSAVTGERLPRNPAKPPLLPRPAPAERHLWTEEQAARFLRFTHAIDPLYADLAELMIGTGMRKGEALALRWDDVHLRERTLFIRATLSAVNNNQLLLTAPKTKGSRAWVALSDRVADALDDRAGSRAFGQITPA
ncbi:site-specific integrase, partial [Saccharothrix sp. ST-888]|uniref:site-specific integrase n=1 Tax=Saccharothrix sp. ST-888 TaxID=1427391 RepID=UPI000698ACEC